MVEASSSRTSGDCFRLLHDVSGGGLPRRILRFLKLSETIALASAAPWQRLTHCRSVALFLQLLRDEGLALNPCLATSGDDLRYMTICESAQSGPLSLWRLIIFWLHVMRDTTGCDWQLGSITDLRGLAAMFSMLNRVNSSIRPHNSRSFRLHIEGFDREDLEDCIRHERDHLFTAGLVEVPLTRSGEHAGEVFLSLERKGGNGGQEFQLACQVCAVEAAIPDESLVLAPMTYHIHICFPPWDRVFSDSMTVDGVVALTSVVSLHLGTVAESEKAFRQVASKLGSDACLLLVIEI
eukprot:TRINITY_DN25956_c0_g1_i2.p1 TRINITY_DN25956_c0_g1~~TRINITY_DN25956_c0_g1_i2.p1  ORF type:complete len:295 (+),score=40.00 TRINITY_DN25956_c0_g1_i2:184-1068(+)